MLMTRLFPYTGKCHLPESLYSHKPPHSASLAKYYHHCMSKCPPKEAGGVQTHRLLSLGHVELVCDTLRACLYSPLKGSMRAP